MLQNFFTKRKIKKYARKLPLDLKTKYGCKRYYAKAQVDAAMKRNRLDGRDRFDISHNCYAYAMYCSPQEFKEIHDKVGQTSDYSALRGHVSTTLFSENADFSFLSLLSVSSKSRDKPLNVFANQGDRADKDSGG
jgi:hypothetical protein